MAMPIITKSQAQALAGAFIALERDRAIQYLTNLATSGIVGGTYTIPGVVPLATLAPVKVELEAAGWTVVVDNPTRMVTIS